MASVRVFHTYTNTVRVEVIGKAGVPTVQLNRDNQRLAFSLTAPTTATATPPPPTPTTPSAEVPIPPGTSTPPLPEVPIPPGTSTPPSAEISPGTPTTPSPETPSPELEQEPVTQTEPPVPPPDTSQSLQERIIVSVTRTEEELSDVPRSVTVITREQIDEQSNLTQDVGDILGQLVPGFAPPTQSTSAFGQSLRGRNVLVLIDGVPQSTSRNVFRDLSTIDPSTIERIEVLRGPTAIYGDGATGGVVNIITRSAGAEALTATTEVGVNSSLTHVEDSLGYSLQQYIAGRSGNFDFAFTASFAETGGFFDAEGDRIPPDPNGQGGLADADTLNLLGKVGVDLSDTQRLQLTVSHFNSEQHTDFTTDPSILDIPGRQKARALEGLELEDPQGTQNTLINLNYTNQNILGSQLQGQLYYRNYSTRFFPFDARDFASLGNVIFQSELDSEKWGGRLQVETPLDQNEFINLLWGLDYSREESSQPVDIFDEDRFDNSNGLVFRETGQRSWTPAFEQSSLGLFAQLKWDVSENFILNGGVRHELIGVSAEDFTTIRGDEIGGGDLDYDATLFNVGAVFYLTDELNLFANFAQGFSVADVGLALRNAPAGFSVDSLRPEAQKVDHFELGIRGNWNTVQASLVGFYNESDLGTTFTAPGTVIRSPQQIYGLEATLDVKPANNWLFGTTVSWTEGERDSDNDGDFDTALDGFTIPPLKLTAYVENQTTPGWRNRLQLLYSGSRDPKGTGFGLNEVDSYITLDYISRINVGAGVLEIGVQNLLNNQYFPVVSQLQTSDTSYAAARGITLSVNYSITW
ncbi:TonB-dependent receptor [Coleofasciculus sp. LEGE 07092]|nr:TonB-dependent receptor [Coleofasciculus sp. LEGE 07081]MBE9148427.1 TonB-dependent receptor [Coleofasciculus sp. LEGE 07092]